MEKLDYDIVFFDMDGVLTDIIHCFKQVFNLPKDWKSTTYYVESQIGMTWEDFHQKLFEAGEDIWSNMKPIKKGVDLVKDLLKAEKQVFILSSPMEGSLSASGKIKWIKKYTPELEGKYVLTHNKELLAAPGRIIVDDYGEHIWKWEKAGGKGLLLRTSYSHEYGEDYTFEEIRKILL